MKIIRLMKIIISFSLSFICSYFYQKDKNAEYQMEKEKGKEENYSKYKWDILLTKITSIPLKYDVCSKFR